jgi:predicted O-methyltransferase YrrM
LETNKTVTTSNIKFVLQHPSIGLAFIRGGKTEAYRVVLEGLLDYLSKCDEPEIKSCLDESASTSSLQLPKKALMYKSVEFSSIAMLYYLVRTAKPDVIIETGVWSGKTSWAILQALSDNGKGHLTSIDLGVTETHGSKLPIDEIGGFVPQNLRKYWKLELGDSKGLLPSILQKLGSIDMFYHDSNHTYEHMTFEFKTALTYIKKGGVICSDDINMNNAWVDFNKLLTNHHEVDNKFGYGNY